MNLLDELMIELRCNEMIKGTDLAYSITLDTGQVLTGYGSGDLKDHMKELKKMGYNLQDDPDYE